MRGPEIQSDPTLVNRLRNLPIWPASGRLQPLGGLYIPGGFEDPLKISGLVDLETLGGRKDFLHDLGVHDLTFETYVGEQIPRVLMLQSDLPVAARRGLVQLLAQRQGEIRDSADLRERLSRVPLVECTDGQFRAGTSVYEQRSGTVGILGEDIFTALPADQNAAAVQELYRWLGVAEEPRPRDVISRISELSKNPPHPETIEIIERVFEYLATQWLRWSDSEKNHYIQLKDMAWLPGIDQPNTWYRPGDIYAAFRSYLFETQATFLNLPRRQQEQAGRAGGLIEFLGIPSEPSVLQVVRHLLYCSKYKRPVNPEVYRFLNDKADDSAIGMLQGKDCLFLPSGDYVCPDQAYWGEHPFGQFRYRLGPELHQYAKLFDRLGVREQPREGDFIQVLLELANRYGPARLPLDTPEHSMVMDWWRKLGILLNEGRLTVEELEVLRDKPVIPNQRFVLYMPEQIFFEDRAGLADKFEGLLEDRAIPLPQGAWQAMEAAGVRRLSHTIELHLLECQDPAANQQVTDRIAERRDLILRIVESEKISGVQDLDVSRLDNLQLLLARKLLVQYSLSLRGHRHQTNPELVPALLMLDEDRLYVVHRNGRIPWPALAREMAYAIKPFGEVGGLAGGIKEALANESAQGAGSVLDELGYPPVQAHVPAPPPDSPRIDGLGGDELTAEGAVADILGGKGPARREIPDTPPEQPSGDHPKRKKAQGKLRTYVSSKDGEPAGQDATSGGLAPNPEVNVAGISWVLEYERAHGRRPIEMDHYHEGYDIESRDDEGHVVRYIEVKSLSGDWGTRNAAGLTRPQFEKARELGDKFWLYVVERATSAEHRQIHCIQDPARRVNQYLYDDGWQALAEAVEESNPDIADQTTI